MMSRKGIELSLSLSKQDKLFGIFRPYAFGVPSDNPFLTTI